MTIRIDFDNSDQRVSAYLEATGDRVAEALRTGMMRAMLKLARYIGTQKLTGQVLKVRTGTLRRAVMGSAEVTTSGTTITGSVSTDPSTWYGKVQEYGAHIPEVSGRLMVFAPAGMSKGIRDKVFTMRRRAFDLPARPFMRTGLAEQREEILAELSQAIDGAIKV